MKPFSLTQTAKSDLRAIAIFTEERWGVAQRNHYIKQFDNAFNRLASSPAIGKRCDDIKPGYCKFPQGSHLIFYSSGSDSIIEIVRILHKSMDTETKLQDT
jgi:toxin ParE1/3/4